MNAIFRSWQGALAFLLCLAALISLPLLTADAPSPFSIGTLALIFALTIGTALLSFTSPPAPLLAAILFAGPHLATWFLISGLAGYEGKATMAFFLLIAACWLLAWRCVAVLSDMHPKLKGGDTFLRLLIPAIFGAWILILWEAITRGAGIPFILLPPPSAIGARIAGSVATLWADVQQTIFKAVLFGYIVG